MSILRFDYSMCLAFDPPVSQHRFTLRCVPRNDARQELLCLSMEVFPQVELQTETDRFGNTCLHGFAEQAHDHFSVELHGTARTGLARLEAATGETLPFLEQTAYTKPGRALRGLAGKYALPHGCSAQEQACTYMEALFRVFRYVPGATSIYTTAEQALSQGEGVCQDYAHILLSLCRMAGIPCRYVVGLLLGEGASHAWVEICENGRWLALDPTHNRWAEDQYIKISSGRDYQDCLINQGVFTGQTRQVQTVYARVTAAEEDDL